MTHRRLAILLVRALPARRAIPGRSRRAFTLTEAVLAVTLALLLLGIALAFMVRSRQLGARTSGRLDQLDGATRAARALGRDLQEALLDPARPPRIGDDGRELRLTVCRGLAPAPGYGPPAAALAYRFDPSTGRLTRREGDDGPETTVTRLPGGTIEFALDPTGDAGSIRVRIRIQPAPPPDAPRVARVRIPPLILERTLWPSMAAAGESLWSLP